ncbi:HAD-IIIA family hydrolase [Virgibacillus soli]|uniref:HAD-IIIA family hydrolase n=1 Tax=Paracerasibacillus soli TaxID=480284 RepID=UPI0035E4A697
MDIEAIFVDRDGTIGGTGHFIHPEDFVPYSFSSSAFQLAKENHIPLFGFTNQHRISKGQATMNDFYNEFKRYGFADAYICPHRMDGDCNCHKPKPGLLLKAAEEHSLDLTKTVVIGDVGSDMLAAEVVGAKKILVLTGWGKSSLTAYRYTWQNVEPDFIAENLLEAIRWIVK